MHPQRLWLASLLLLIHSQARAATVNAAPPPLSSMEQTAAAELARVVQDNSQFAAQHDDAYFDRFRDRQVPRTTLVACSDSRFQTDTISRASDGDLFVVRNIGNQLESNFGSIEYEVRHLHTPLLMIVGHVDCGAIRAAMQDYGDESPSIRRELDSLHLSLAPDTHRSAITKRWLENVTSNVHQQVRDAQQEFAVELAAHQLVVVGAIYDFRNDLGRGKGKLSIVNVNGQTDPQKIAELPLMHGQDATPYSESQLR